MCFIEGLNKHLNLQNSDQSFFSLADYSELLVTYELYRFSSGHWFESTSLHCVRYPLHMNWILS